MKIINYILAGAIGFGSFVGCGVAHKDGAQLTSTVQFKKGEVVAQFDKFYANYVNEMSPLYIAANTAYFEASVNNSEENWNKYAEMDMKMNAIMSNKAKFDTIKAFMMSNEITDPLKVRQLKVMYNDFMTMQVDTAISNQLTQMNSKIEGKFSGFRAKVNGKELSDNQVENILINSTDNKELEQVWTEQKKIGRLVAKDIIAIAKKRNEVAHKSGFDNYHTMCLARNEQDPKEIEKLFDELDNLTRNAFAREKAKMDVILAKKVGIKPSELMPWNYQNRFFQEAPSIYDLDIDKYFKDKDVVKLTEEYYATLGLPINDMVAKSDLYEKPGKNQHAYCINIDRDQDVRVLCNVKNNESWMSTMLHEFGHALYEKHYSKDLPWNLKNAAHIFTTEGIAMLFERLPLNTNWLRDFIKVPESDIQKMQKDIDNTVILQKLVFSRWVQVMYRFEKGLYANPDQDLNKLWWDLVEKYQMIKKPEGRNEPDWATKIHVATFPCYYHNYMLGELFASQLYFTLAKQIGQDGMQNPSFIGKKEIGKYLIDNVISIGMRYKWEDMVQRCTGEPLSAKYYAKQFVK